MKYTRIHWKHDFPDEPVTYYAEIDDERWEQRAIVVYRDGSTAYAVRGGKDTGAHLGEDPLPELTELAKDSEFDAAEISRDVFEAKWADRDRSPTSLERKKTRRVSRPKRS